MIISIAGASSIFITYIIACLYNKSKNQYSELNTTSETDVENIKNTLVYDKCHNQSQPHTLQKQN